MRSVVRPIVGELGELGALDVLTHTLPYEARLGAGVAGEDGPTAPRALTVPLDPAAAAEAVQARRDAEPAVTGICAYNDEVALAVLAGARRQGFDVPGDLAVIGADNIPAAAVSIPTLTTVQPDLQALSGHIADTIVSKLTGGPSPRRPWFHIHSLIRRDSA